MLQKEKEKNIFSLPIFNFWVLKIWYGVSSDNFPLIIAHNMQSFSTNLFSYKKK